jgi:MFS family permease
MQKVCTIIGGMAAFRFHHGWTAFSILTVLFMLSFFHRVAPGAIAGELQQAFAVGGVALGALAGTYFYVYFVMQIPTGVLADTLGPRRVVTVGAVIAGIGSVIFGLAPDLTTAVLGRALVGLGVSVFFICLLKVAANWFGDHRFATATGTAVFAGNMGAVLATAPLAYVVAHGSWRSVFLGVGALLLVLAALAWRYVRDAPTSTGRSQATAAERVAWPQALTGVFRTAAIWPGVVAMCTAGTTYSAFIGLWAVPYLMQVHGMSRGVAATHTSIALASFAVCSLAVGTLSDRIGRRRPMLIGGLTLYSLCWTPLLVFDSMPLAASYALFGALGGAATAFTLLWACAKEVCPPHLAGMSTSMVNTGQFLGVGLLQPLIGWILDRGWQGATREGMRLYSAGDFRLGIAVLFGLTVTGLLASLLIRETYCRNVHSEHRGRNEAQDSRDP